MLARDGTDCTHAYRKGAERALAMALAAGCSAALLTARSPSCGAGEIYDGSFTKTLVPGDGVFAGLCRQQGLALFTEESFPWEALEADLGPEPEPGPAAE